MLTTVSRDMHGTPDQSAEYAIQRAAAVQHFLLDLHGIPMRQVTAVFASAGLWPGVPADVEGWSERSNESLVRDFLCRLSLVEEALTEFEDLGLAENIDAVTRYITSKRARSPGLERAHPIAERCADEFSNW